MEGLRWGGREGVAARLDCLETALLFLDLEAERLTFAGAFFFIEL